MDIKQHQHHLIEHVYQIYTRGMFITFKRSCFFNSYMNMQVCSHEYEMHAHDKK